MEVHMKLKHLFTVNIFFAVFFGLTCAFFAGWALRIYGLAPEPHEGRKAEDGSPGQARGPQGADVGHKPVNPERPAGEKGAGHSEKDREKNVDGKQMLKLHVDLHRLSSR